MRSRRASKLGDRPSCLDQRAKDGLGVALILRTLDRLRLRAGALDHSACHPCGEERDEGDADHHFDTADDLAHAGRGHDISVTDRGDGLQRPPDRHAQGREVVGIGDPHHDRSDESQRDEGEGKAKDQRSRVGDPPNAVLDEGGPLRWSRAVVHRHEPGVQRGGKLPSRPRSATTAATGCRASPRSTRPGIRGGLAAACRATHRGRR